MNTYRPRSNDGNSGVNDGRSNPARTLLYVIGAIGLIQGVMGIPIGLFVGPHILGAAIVSLVFGSTSIWLGQRQYDGLGRCGTIMWAILGVVLVVVGTVLQPPSMNDAPGLVFTALLLVVFGTVLSMAVWKRSGERVRQ